MSVDDTEKFAAWDKFLKAGSTVLKTLEREMEDDQHFPLNWYDVLVWLNQAPGGRMRMQSLADSIYLSNSGLTRRLNRMAEAGLVERESCEEDRRGWYAVITPKGREVVEKVSPGLETGIRSHFLNYLNDRDIQDLSRIMDKIIGR